MWAKITIVILALIIFFALMHRSSAPRHVEATQTEDAVPSKPSPAPSETPSVAATAFADPSLQPDKEIIFAKSLVITRKTISVDGLTAQIFACISADSAAPTFFGFITLADGTRVNLSCVSGYQGTVDLQYPGLNGETQKYIVASADTDDAGAWDLRSWITKDPQGELSIRSITLSSDTSAQDTEGVKCNQSEKFTTWNAQERDFADATPTGQPFDLVQFELPINVSPGCLDTDGTWKKK